MALGKFQAVIASAALACLAAAPARAASATVTAAVAPEGYARIVFAFDAMPDASAKLVNGILVVSFGESVSADISPISKALGAIVAVARRDPDGAAIRISLKQPLRLSSTEAGDTLYVDLLPQNWVGLPPSVPKETIAALGREAREGRAIRAEKERRRAAPVEPLTVTGANNPTFRRLQFTVGDDVEVSYARVGERVAVTFGSDLPFDVAAARARLPAELAITAQRKNGTLTVYAPAPGERDIRGFREDGTFIVDIDRDDATPTGNEAVEIAPSVHATPASHAAPAPASRPVAATQAKPDAGAGSAPFVAAAAPAADHAPAQAAPAAPAASQLAAPATASKPHVARAGDTLRLVFPFPRATPAAIFRRGATLWAVFDDPQPLDLDGLVRESGGAVAAASQSSLDGGRLVRLTLADSRVVTAAANGPEWVVSLGDALFGVSAPVELKPVYDAAGAQAMRAEAPALGAIRTIEDPDFHDRLIVATLGQPARKFALGRQFVEFSTLATAQGLALAPIADDLQAVGEVDRLTISRKGGLALTGGTEVAVGAEPSFVALSAAEWAAATEEPFSRREHALLTAAALSAPEQRSEARLALARFYMVRDRPAEAAGVLGAIIEDDPSFERDARAAILRAAAEVELGRAAAALGLLSRPSLAANPEAALWRAAAQAEMGRPGPARESLKQGEPALPLVTPPVQARFVELAIGLALDAGDAASAAAKLERLEVLPAIRGPGARDVLRARITQALGQTDRALAQYASIARGRDPIAAAEAELRAVDLGLNIGKTQAADAVTRLERLVAGWRGDWIEAEALTRLVTLYGDVERWRDAFATLQVAVRAFPDADGSRALQDEMQSRFTRLFLNGGGLDRMPKLDALALFYDFKELSPGGKRGDELVRRLADKLVDVDLLDQAAELLEYQIDNRLTGAARAQVAARAAIVELMNNKPAAAADILRRTRQADLPASLMNARLALEARALAMTGRTELALEMARGIEGLEGRRLAADILWTSRRWTEAGEAFETLLGSAWRGPAPLDAEQRTQALRAAVALSLGDDALGVDRLRQKFGPKMAAGPDAASFEVVTAPVEARGDAFREVARTIATTSAFDAFLREYKRRGAEEAPSASAENEAAGRKA